jgi:hypothetical protein
VSLFVLSPDIKTETKLRSAIGRSTKRPSTLKYLRRLHFHILSDLASTYMLRCNKA